MLRRDRLLLMSVADPPTRGAAPLAGLLACQTPFLFFTGKGGVGKTSIAAATAVALAEDGARVLIVSTDPASNLDEVLGVHAGTSATPVPVPGVAGLTARNIDPDAAAAAYRERVVGPYRALLPAAVVAKMEEELSGSCTVEIAAFNEFVALLADPTVADAYDRIVFDTAPTGHTLRLLTLPGAWTGFLQSNRAGVTCIGPISVLGQTRDRYADAVAALRNPARTTLVLVTRPDVAALGEAARAAGELSALGVVSPRLVINGVLGATDTTDAVAQAWQGRARAALAGMPPVLAAIEGVDTIPLLPAAPVGLDGLHLLLRPETAGFRESRDQGPASRLRSGLGDLVQELEAAGPGVVMTMGKGGVGKTTVAAAIAVALAGRGHPVTLTTTDPAAHVADALPDPPRNLTVTRIDPAAETASYMRSVLASAGKDLDEQAYALLEEDLRSPCTVEVAVFQAFARTVAAAIDRYVVIDTAPTGHTVLLLELLAQLHPPTGGAVGGPVRSGGQAARHAHGRRAHPHPAGDRARGNPRPRGGQASGRSRPCRHRSFRMGRQREPRRDDHHRPGAAGPGSPGTPLGQRGRPPLRPSAGHPRLVVTAPRRRREPGCPDSADGLTIRCDREPPPRGRRRVPRPFKTASRRSG